MEWIAVWAGLLGGVENPLVAIAFRPYRRQFVQPLKTAHGLWHDRRGLILQLQAPTKGGSSGDNVSYGEIAPIPWFGTETLEDAIAFLTQLQADQETLSLADLSAIVERSPSHYCATRFGLGMAIAQLQGGFPPGPTAPKPQQICALLPSGRAALDAWPKLWQQGYHTFKWKISIADRLDELDAVAELRRSLPSQAKLRLDANGGLELKAAQQFLSRCDDLARQNLPIEFLEQPLSPKQFEHLLDLSRTYRTPIALDESVTGLTQLKDCHQRGWEGIFVVKGAIAGDPLAVINYCCQQQLKVVFSSVFETGLARQAVFAMAQAIQPQTAPQPPILKVGEGKNTQDKSWVLNSPCPSLGRKGTGDGSQPGWHSGETKIVREISSDYALGFGVSQWLRLDGLDEQGQPTDLKLRGEQLWQRLLG